MLWGTWKSCLGFAQNSTVYLLILWISLLKFEIEKNLNKYLFSSYHVTIVSSGFFFWRIYIEWKIVQIHYKQPEQYMYFYLNSVAQSPEVRTVKDYFSHLFSLNTHLHDTSCTFLRRSHAVNCSVQCFWLYYRKQFHICICKSMFLF